MPFVAWDLNLNVVYHVEMHFNAYFCNKIMLITPLTLRSDSRSDANFPILKLFWKAFPSITCIYHGWLDHPIFIEKVDWKENRLPNMFDIVPCGI